jgi:glycolate oxidase FAD binding subunit
MAVGGRVPQYIVDPPTAESVAAVLKFAADRDLAVIPRGNGTKLTLSSPPRRYDLALSLKELNHVWHYEPADLTTSVEAGMKLGDFQDFLGGRGALAPLGPARWGKGKHRGHPGNELGGTFTPSFWLTT